MKIRISKILLFFILFSSCTQLLVENPNEPDLTKVFSTTEELHNYAGSAFRTLHNAMQDYVSPATPMAVMADQSTCSWNGAAMRYLSSEPRQGWNNSVNFPYRNVTQIFWEDCYDAISTCNDVLRLINPSEKIEPEQNEIQKLKAWSYFVSGISHGYLGLTFDKECIVNWDTSPDSINYSDWNIVIEASLEMLQKVNRNCRGV